LTSSVSVAARPESGAGEIDGVSSKLLRVAREALPEQAGAQPAGGGWCIPKLWVSRDQKPVPLLQARFLPLRRDRARTQGLSLERGRGVHVGGGGTHRGTGNAQGDRLLVPRTGNAQRRPNACPPIGGVLVGGKGERTGGQAFGDALRIPALEAGILGVGASGRLRADRGGRRPGRPVPGGSWSFRVPGA
jgi:hypothetical protein